MSNMHVLVERQTACRAYSKKLMFFLFIIYFNMCQHFNVLLYHLFFTLVIVVD